MSSSTTSSRLPERDLSDAEIAVLGQCRPPAFWARLWECSDQHVRNLARDGAIPAWRAGTSWLIPVRPMLDHIHATEAGPWNATTTAPAAAPGNDPGRPRSASSPARGAHAGPGDRTVARADRRRRAEQIAAMPWMTARPLDA